MNGLHVKPDLQGLLIYVSMAGFALCFLATMLWMRSGQSNRRLRGLIAAVFAAASVMSIVSVAYRWVHVRHLPMQNMFEVFLVLGACAGPIGWLSRRIIRWHPIYAAIDAVIALIVLFPAGFVFHHQPQLLPPALQSWLFGPHVAAYMLAYIFMAKAGVFAAADVLIPSSNTSARSTIAGSAYKMTAAGFPFLTVGLFLGSVWGKLAWGDWWGWDPKELWSLVCWLIFAIYFHVRIVWPGRYRLHHIFVLLGVAAIIITLLWVNLSKVFQGLHNYAA